MSLRLMEHFSHKLGKIFGYSQQKNPQFVATVKYSLMDWLSNLLNLASSGPHQKEYLQLLNPENLTKFLEEQVLELL